MSNIVRIKRTDWLRAIATRMDAHDMGTHDDADEIRWAADEIERLRAERDAAYSDGYNTGYDVGFEDGRDYVDDDE